MKNFVFMISLVIVQGSSLFEHELENYNGLKNEGSNALAVSTYFAQLNGDASDLKSQYSKNAIGTSPIHDKLQRQFTALDFFVPPLGIAHLIQYLRHGHSGNYNKKFKVVHPIDPIGELEDLFLAIHKIPEAIAREAAQFIPELMSLKFDLGGFVKCHDLQCNIIITQLGLLKL
ncbi:hypothetical protein CHS0354_014025 [Potamilus streckersoni]|uniref:Uncharacterized protein n=1 Tax=Potamilus streckersoni TaxID=2493646 RepID=A0AAE0TL87_9BIVA|nr:hypothetical protein CHS0354_014025 [Potamilus streckersoni]